MYRVKKDMEPLTFRRSEFTKIKISEESVINWLKANLFNIALNKLRGEPHFSSSETVNIDVIIKEKGG